MLDANGEVLHPAVTFKAVSYEKLIPILVGGHQEQNNEIAQLMSSNDSLIQQNQNLQEQINDLNERLKKLESCLLNILPQLCEMNQAAIQLNS